MQDAGISSFIIFLAIVWFLMYWVIGGVFFAVMAIIRLGRVRKVRFSCLFTLLAMICAVGASYLGMNSARQAILGCSTAGAGHAQLIIAVMGCGFAGIMGMFLFGGFVLTVGGFVIMGLSKPKTKPWITFDQDAEEDEMHVNAADAAGKPTKKSRFF